MNKRKPYNSFGIKMPRTKIDYQQRENIKQYAAKLRATIMTIRYTKDTWQQYQQYLVKHPKLTCIYSSHKPISSRIRPDSTMILLEMNRDTGRIEGVSLVKNQPICDKYHIYENGNSNRYVYVGKHHIHRDEMTEDENTILTVFDILCFNGNKRLKRGRGISPFPVEKLYYCSSLVDLYQFISEMFKRRKGKPRFLLEPLPYEEEL